MTICLGAPARPEQRAAPLSADRPASFRVGYVETLPAPDLARYIEKYWISRWLPRGSSSRTATALLDPCVHLQIRNGQAEVMGVSRGTYQVELENAGFIIGVKFRPGGFYPFVRQPVSQWTGRTVSMAQCLVLDGNSTTAWARALWTTVDTCSGDADEHTAILRARLDAFLGPLLAAHDEIAEELVRLVACISARADVHRIDDLTRLSGRSARSLQRLFLRYVGVSPAWVIRRYRLHAAARKLATLADVDVQGLAYELGYADQAHFIRDFRATIGVTPGAYVRARYPARRAREKSSSVTGDSHSIR